MGESHTIEFCDFLLVHTCLGQDAGVEDGSEGGSEDADYSDSLNDIRWSSTADAQTALRLVRAKVPESEVKFTVIFRPFQLHPDVSKDGEDKYEWYKRNRCQDSDEQMEKYTKVMSEYGKTEGIDFKFHGKIANTLDAHRVIQHFQTEPHGSPEIAAKIIDSLYQQYFTMERHPSAPETLLSATSAAGVPEEKARAIIEDEQDGLRAVRDQIRMQGMDGVDSVPYIIMEGKRRDFTLVGAKALEQYIASLDQVVSESK